MRSVLVLSLLFVSSLAHAQPGMTAPIAPQQTAVQTSDEKDPSTAVLLSLGIPVAGAIMLGASDSAAGKWVGAGALYFGPSTGQWYAGQAGGLGLGLRAIGGVSMIYGLITAINSDSECDFDDNGGCSDDGDHSGTMGGVLVLTGAGLWVGSSIYDIVLAKRAAESWNARHSVALTPGLIGTSGTRTPGLVLSGRF
jgi:hypothetical protein